MLLNVNFILLNLLGVKCCNVYSDFCDTMETETEDSWAEVRVKREEKVNITKHQMASRVSQILDNLFGAGYNKQFRPGQSSLPVAGFSTIIGRGPTRLGSRWSRAT